MIPGAGLPPLGPGVVPARVREEGPEAEQAYRAAMGFERMLAGQLAKALEPTAQDEESGDPAAASYQGMISDSVADAVTAGGGLGLADSLYRALRPQVGS